MYKRYFFRGDKFEIELPQVLDAKWEMDIPAQVSHLGTRHKGDKVVYRFEAVDYGTGIITIRWYRPGATAPESYKEEVVVRRLIGDPIEDGHCTIL